MFIAFHGLAHVVLITELATARDPEQIARVHGRKERHISYFDVTQD